MTADGCLFEEADLISSYSRAQALADGMLVDVTEWASVREMRGGFTVPVAVTAALWSGIEAIPERLKGCQDVRGRAHDVLWLASLAARGAARSGREDAYYTVTLPVRGTSQRKLRLRVNISGGDEGEPVVTIGLPEDF